MSVLRVEDVSVDYRLHGRHFRLRPEMFRAVSRFSMTIDRGETVGLVGETGSGKSTVGRVVLGLLKPAAGGVWFEDQLVAGHRAPPSAMHRIRRDVGAVFQDPYASLNPRQRLERIIELPIRIHERLDRGARRRRVLELLERVGLQPAERFAKAFPHQLSGGQRQRVAIARAIALQPKLLVADEPISALDVSVGAQILNLLRGLQAELGIALLFISHDLATVQAIADRAAVMYKGRIVEHGPAKDVLLAATHPYTQLLVASIPELLGTIDARTVAPRRMSEPSGGRTCTFVSRCPYAFERCVIDEPPLFPITSNHSARCVLVDEPVVPTEWTAARRRLAHVAASAVEADAAT